MSWLWDIIAVLGRSPVVQLDSVGMLCFFFLRVRVLRFVVARGRALSHPCGGSLAQGMRPLLSGMVIILLLVMVGGALILCCAQCCQPQV